jgi:hypothetical protein
MKDRERKDIEERNRDYEKQKLREKLNNLKKKSDENRRTKEEYSQYHDKRKFELLQQKSIDNM